METGEILFFYFYPEIKIFNSLFWECNFTQKDIEIYLHGRKQLSFWRDLLTLWGVFNYSVPNTKNEIKNEIIWLNSHIKIGKKIVFYQKFIGKGNPRAPFRGYHLRASVMISIQPKTNPGRSKPRR